MAAYFLYHLDSRTEVDIEMYITALDLIIRICKTSNLTVSKR